MGSIGWTTWLCVLSILLSFGAAQISVDVPRQPPANQGGQLANPELLREMLSTVLGSRSSPMPLQEMLTGTPVWLLGLEAQLQNGLLRITNGTSGLCLNQTIYMLRNLQSPWAAAMLDSFGRRPAGILEGNLKWLGDFDECVNAKTGEEDRVQVHGKYCKFPLLVNAGKTPVPATVGGCFPAGCSSNDLKSLVFSFLEQVIKVNKSDKSIAGFYMECQPESLPLSDGAVVAIVVCSLFGAGILIGTAYDVLQNISASKAKEMDQEPGNSVTELSQLGTSAGSGVTTSEEHVADQQHKIDLNKSNTNEKFSTQVLPFSIETAGEPLKTNGLNKELPEHKPSVAGSVQANESSRANATNKLGRLGRLILCFSIYTNGRKLLLSSSQGDKTLSCLHGIRFLSMCWVVLGHTYFFSGSIANDIGTFLRVTAPRESFMAIANASFAVDTFFLLSSLLVVYLMLKELNKRSGRLTARQWVFIYVHRYLRLTGIYAVVLMLWVCLTSYMYEGPQWWTSTNPDPACTDNWWTNLLYVNNFVELQPGINCMGWAWYLANDMQMFLITPVLTFIMYHFAYVGFGITLLLTLGSVVASTMVAKDMKYTASFVVGVLDPLRSLDVTSKHYIKPWNRFQAYGVGIMVAYLIYKCKGKYTIPKLLAFMGWMIAAGSALAALYGPYELMVGDKQLTHTDIEIAIYAGLSRLAWVLGVAWVIYVCSTGQGGWVNQLLSWKPFVPLGRLCYCAYLVHPILMMAIQQGGRDTIHLDDVTMIVRFLGELTLVLAVSFLTSLAFEAPLLRVEKLALGGES